MILIQRKLKLSKYYFSVWRVTNEPQSTFFVLREYKREDAG